MTGEEQDVLSGRSDFQAIAAWVRPDATVLDLGCGDGLLLRFLEQTRNARGYGVDIADANVYQASGLFDDIVLHEMLHTMGFGTLWESFGLIDGVGTATPTFNGAFANDVYPGPDPIPVEADGANTAYTHWDEAVFGNELMTGYIDGDNELSYMTIASLSDLGYSVVLGASYEPPSFI